VPIPPPHLYQGRTCPSHHHTSAGAGLAHPAATPLPGPAYAHPAATTSPEAIASHPDATDLTGLGGADTLPPVALPPVMSTLEPPFPRLS